MRHIYVDEAGISRDEPATVVIGLIVHVDTQWLQAARAFSELLSIHVPEKYKDGFIFHAQKIWGHQGYRDVWTRESRMSLLTEVMNLPMKLGMSLSISVVRRFWKPPPMDMPVEQYQHLTAFAVCIAQADQFIREHCAQGEMASVVAEDVAEKRKFFRNALSYVRTTPLSFSGGDVAIPVNFRVERVIDTVFFVAKTPQMPLLQIADACAYGMRRYFAREKYGEEFKRAIVGPEIPPPDHQAPFTFLLVGPSDPMHEFTYTFNP